MKDFEFLDKSRRAVDEETLKDLALLHTGHNTAGVDILGTCSEVIINSYPDNNNYGPWVTLSMWSPSRCLWGVCDREGAQ